VSEPRRCPVAGCHRALGTTRQGDPHLMCAAHYLRLDNGHRIQLWRAYRAWQRVERAYLKAKAAGINAKPHLDARAEAIKEYLVIRDDCVTLAARGEGRQLELAQ